MQGQHADVPRTLGNQRSRHGSAVALHLNWYRIGALGALFGFWVVAGAALWRVS